MKKNQKLFSIIVVLSLVLSCFGNITIFAEDQFTAEDFEYVVPSNEEIQKILDSSESNNSLSENYDLYIKSETVTDTSIIVTFGYNESGDYRYLLGKSSEETYYSVYTYEPDNFTVTLDKTLDYDFFVVNKHFLYYDEEEEKPVFEDIPTNHVQVFGYPIFGPLTVRVDEVTENTISLSWSYPEPPHTSVYFIIHQHNPYIFFELTDNFSATINVEPITTYNITVEAGHCGNYLDSTTVTVKTGTMPAPANLNASISNNTMPITWDAVAGATGYDIMVNDEVLFENRDTNSLTYHNIFPSRLYQIKVRARNDNVYGAWSTINLYYGAYGDLNRDGLLDDEDVAIMTGYLMGEIELDNEQMVLADLDGSGRIDNSDVLLLKGNVGKTTPDFPVGVATYFTNTNRTVKFLRYGDLNKDGAVNQDDITILSNYLSQSASLDTEQRILADVDGNRVINIADLTFIRWYIEIETITSLPLGRYAAFYTD